MKEGELTYFKLSRDFFPFEKEILVSEALYSIRSKLVTERVYLALKDALKYDPYSIEMLGMYIQYANKYNDKKDALLSYQRLQKIAPDGTTIKKLAGIGVKF